MMVNDGEWEVFLSLRGEFGRNSLKFTDHYQTWGLRPDMANLQLNKLSGEQKKIS